MGTATARDLSNRNSTLKLAIVEKEHSIGNFFFFFVLCENVTYHKIIDCLKRRNCLQRLKI